MGGNEHSDDKVEKGESEHDNVHIHVGSVDTFNNTGAKHHATDNKYNRDLAFKPIGIREQGYTAQYSTEHAIICNSGPTTIVAYQGSVCLCVCVSVCLCVCVCV